MSELDDLRRDADELARAVRSNLWLCWVAIALGGLSGACNLVALVVAVVR